MMKIIIVTFLIIYFIVSSLFIYFCLVLNSRIEDKPKLKKIKPDDIEKKRMKIDKIIKKECRKKMSNHEIFKETNDLLKKLDDLIKRIEKQKEKQKLIGYLKEQISNLHWEMSELILGMYDTKFQDGKLSAYEEILDKIEKRNK